MLVDNNGTITCDYCGRVYYPEDNVVQCPADDCPGNEDDCYYADGVEDDDYVVTGCEEFEYDSGDQYDMEYDH